MNNNGDGNNDNNNNNNISNNTDNSNINNGVAVVTAWFFSCAAPERMTYVYQFHCPFNLLHVQLFNAARSTIQCVVKGKTKNINT